MKKSAMLLALFLFLSLSPTGYAVTPKITPAEVASPSAVATESAQVVKEPSDDLTVPTKEKGRLEKVLEGQRFGGWWGVNFLKIAIRNAVAQGVSPNTLVVLFLFPLVAALVAFSRQVLGISGFGIITPALLSVAFLSTGGAAGLVLLSFILIAGTISRMIIKKVRVPYLPKMAMIFWIVSMAIVGLLISSPKLALERLIGVGIFPILLFILLSETFIEAQITRSLKTAMIITAETVILALIAYRIMSAVLIQEFVLLNPELSVILILMADYLIGRYKGLRLMEVWKFRNMVKK